jgi:hypothetical protein
VSDYRLDYHKKWVRSPAVAKNFSSSLCVQTSYGAHPASSPTGTGGTFPEVKRGLGVTLITHPILRRGQECVGSIQPLFFVACMTVAGQLYFIFTFPIYSNLSFVTQLTSCPMRSHASSAKQEVSREISGSQGGAYEVQSVLRCTVESNRCLPTFQRCVLPPSSQP